MAISRSLMNRQLRADGGIMQVAPREKFGLGSSIKKFVRKIIPNEVAEVAVKAAPFVAPFNPAVAAAMSGLGTFDQTGSIGDSLKGGALTYGLGQGARYLGGADFQALPGTKDFGGLGGFTEFSSPLGTQTGFKLGKPVQEVQGVGIDTTMPKPKPTNLLSEQRSEVSLSPSGAVTDTVSSTVATPGSAMDSFNVIKSFNTSAGQKTDAALDLLKRGSKALFTNKDGSPDKAAILGAVTAAASYAEARALAADVGVDLTEEEYDESLRDEKKAEYAGYLQNFFGGKKDGGRIGFKSGYSPGIVSAALEEYNSVYGTDSSGEEILVKDLYSGGFEEFLEIYTGDAYEKRANGGRIGFESGANEMIKTQLLEEIMPKQDGEEMITIMTEDGPIQVKKSVYESMPQMFIDTTTSAYGDAGRGRPVPEFAKGGRIGFKKGSDPVYEMYLEDLEAGIIPSDKSYNEYLDDIEDDPDYDYSYAKGGRVSRKFGSPKEGESEVGIMTIDVEAGDDEDEENMMMAGGITFSSAEKSFLFKKLGGAGGADRSFTMPQLYGILKNPNSPSNIDDAKVLKEIAIMGLGKGQKDGGRIGFESGANENFYAPSPKKITEFNKDMVTEFMAGNMPEFKGELMSENYTQGGVSDLDAIFKIYSMGGSYDDIRETLNSSLTDIELEKIIQSMKPKQENFYAETRAKGGRIGYKGGANRVSELLILRDEKIGKGEDVSDIEAEIFQLTGKTFRSVGGISDVPTGKMRKNNAGVTERDYRDEGGFVPVGIKERADDVPAMLSKNEFVMTADAVRGIGNGSVEEGSKKLYNTMKQAEKVGKA